MPIEKVEFTFPDEEDNDTLEIEKSSARTMGDEDFDKSFETEEALVDNDDSSESEDIDLEIVDDTPEEDRDRTPSDPPEDITEDELQNYSEKVRKRIQRFSKGYHDERRAKETAFRERQELEVLAKRLYDENLKLKGSVGKSNSALLDQAKKVVENDILIAKQKYRDAYENGNADAILDAQELLSVAYSKSEKLKNISPQSLQTPEERVQPSQQAPVQEKGPPQQTADPRALKWAEKNTWYGQNDEMTSFALGCSHTLIKNGVDPTSDEYYDKINRRMREVFPDQFSEERTKDSREKTRTKQSVVAPATRSKTPKRIRLTKSQVAIAKRLGVPLESYAEQVAHEMRKSNV